MKNKGTVSSRFKTYIACGALFALVFSTTSCESKNDIIKRNSEEIAALKAQLEEIKLASDELLEKNNELAAEIENIKIQNQEIIDAKDAEINQKTDELNALQVQLEVLTNNIVMLNNQIQNLNDQISTLEGDKTELQNQLTALQQQKEQADQTIAQLNNQIQQAQQQIATLEQEKKALQEELDNLQNFTVTFNSNGGSAVASQKKILGATVDKPKDPTKTGYTFVKWIYSSEGLDWDFEHDTVPGNITLDAVWSPNTYKVTYSLEGGAFNPTHASSDNVVYDSKYNLPSVKKDGFTLVKWVYDGGTELKSGTWKIAKNITANCVWAKSVSVITYDFGYEGIDNVTQNIDYNATISLLVPKRTGYTFTGWTYQGTPFSGGKYTYYDDITLVGTWSANSYDLELDGGEGTYSGAPISTVTFDSEFELPVCEPLNEDRPFAGWFMDRKRITDELGHSLEPWTYADGASLVAKYFHPISTVDDFKNIAENPETIYSLVNDLDFDGEEIEPLDIFKGELWGMDYSIKGISFKADQTNIGLFKTISGAVFSDINFASSSITVEADKDNATYYVGLLASQAYNDGDDKNTFKNVTYSNLVIDVTASSSKVIMGGLVGIAQDLVLDNVASGGVIKAKSSGNTVEIGGFVGESVGNILTNKYVNEAEVYSYALGGEHPVTHATFDGYAGGLVGVCNTVDLNDTFNDGIVEEDSVKKTNSYAGGIIGRNNGRPVFSNVANRGTVKASTYGGGVLGCSALKGSFAFTNIYNDGNVSDSGETGIVGGVIGRCIVDTFISGVYNSGSVTSTNGISGGLVGASTNILRIYESYNEGLVKSINGAAGGLAGQTNIADIRDCYNVGIIEAKNYAGGLIAININPSTSILHTYIGGTVKVTDDSTSGYVGAFVGDSASTIISNSFAFGLLVGFDGQTNSLVGQMKGGAFDKVSSSATLKDLSDNILSDTASVERVSIEAFTPTYITEYLTFNINQWIIQFDVAEGLYPKLKCFEVSEEI